ncbi:bifunctional riboflavin kinase/FAD synthetase [Isachenkonia alkalipeptolytica]|uniref:Riboflavin biosynthesis protein n=1 Tax=Isachenkonia alkalipeptolytica TaxID=2565777 RepID=A0AA43XJQ5_9CLOT|nr:bifunctional riboflavin kinase/FAD synthetase [Isachenkonia alkalipeptolytica]NBG87616.1 bifunctional riboflavin kinase/FAD synthetase [Isachenkonia alkalipeptolytica]
MNILKLDKSYQSQAYRGIALGNFDGVHLGHQQLLKAVRRESQKRELCPSVYTFLNHPRRHQGEATLKEITSLQKKAELFAAEGIKELILSPFNDEIKNMEPEVFITEVLVKQLKSKLIVVGFDYRFGKKARGNPEMLKTLGKIHGFEVCTIHPYNFEEEKISSSKIRGLIEKGEVAVMEKYLGRYYAIRGPVIRGKGLGTTLGFPTANIKIDSNQILPKSGVYATFSRVDDKIYPSVTSVGHQPKFNDRSAEVESFFMDYEGNLYSRTVETIFVKYIRGQISYETPEALRRQIEKDAKEAKQHLHSKIDMINY